MKSGLAKIRSKNQPKLPQTITQIDLDIIIRLLIHNTSICGLITKKNRIMLFSSPIGLKMLSHSLFWHGDNIFHCAAKYFMQLYIIHCWTEHRMIPAVIALMKRRRMKDYVQLLEVLNWKHLILVWIWNHNRLWQTLNWQL